MGEAEISAFLTDLAVVQGVSASTQNQALHALLFLYRHVLMMPLVVAGDIVRARRGRRLPVVLSVSEVKAILIQMRGVPSGVRGSVLPDALARKMPSAGADWRWQYLFPATQTYMEKETGARRRHHLHESVLQRQFAGAVRASGTTKRATCHSLRHSFATHLLETQVTAPGPRAVRELDPA